jgi:ribosomal protein L10
MSTGEQVEISVNGEELSTVTSNNFLEAVITNYSYTKNEINRIISLGKAATANFTYVMKASGVSTNSQVKLVHTTDFPAVLYGCERWMLRKAN